MAKPFVSDIVHKLTRLPRLNFITIKSHDEKEWRISFWSDRLRKISDNFFIVREKNTQNEGYHFHALVALSVDTIPVRWFKKGVHTHITPIGDSNPYNMPQMPNDAEEAEYLALGEDFKDMDMDERTLAIGLHEVKQIATRKRAKCRREGHYQRVLSYMTKTGELLQYESYLLILNKKSVPLNQAATVANGPPGLGGG